MSITQFLPIIYIFCFFLIILLLDAAINFFIRESFIGYKYRYFVAPGVIVHEFSHALAALLTFHKIEKISLFDPNGGYVIHQKTREPLSQVIISFAPIIGISLCFFLITYFLQPSWLQHLDHINLHTILENLSHTSFHRWQTWLHLYLSVSFATCLAPSRQDFKVAFTGVFILFLLFLLVSISGLQPFLMNSLAKTYLLVGFIIAFLLFALLISFIFYSITKIIKI